MTTPKAAPAGPQSSAQAETFWPKRIGRRVAFAFAALVALMLLAMLQAALQLRAVNDLTQRFATGDMQLLLRVQSLALQTERVGSTMIRLIHAPRDKRVSEYTELDSRNRLIDNIIESLDSELKDPDEAETLRRLKACRANYADAYLLTAEEVEKGDVAAAVRLLNDKVNPALVAMVSESNALLQLERERIEKRLDDALRLFDQFRMWAAGLALVVIALAAWLAWRTTQSVVGPLATLEAAARRVASGDYAGRVPVTGTTEIDQVGAALNTMAETVAQRELQIVRLAYEDALTGLPNRTALLHPAQPSPMPHNTLALLDLARLKVINETLGYVTGDTLIKELAVRASTVFAAMADARVIGAAPLVARLAGGTFAVAFFAPDRPAAERVNAQLQQAMALAVQCSGHHVDLNVTSGYADSTGHDEALPIVTLLRNAEVALHTAKRTAVGHAWHSEAQEAARLVHLSLISDLRQAVAESQLQMWLQPKFSLVTGKAVGAEALVRWQHPSRGFVSPAEFVPFAEQTGYITMVTDWMLRAALQKLKEWEPLHPELTIAVNVSTRDLQDAGFAQRVAKLLSEFNVSPKRLRIEITESGLMEDAAKSIALLHTLRDIGLPLSIDDFGTGYSSLAYLQKLPVSELKIDRAFIDKIDSLPGTQKLVKAMIEMGHGMDLVVTAEGVETQAEKDTITHLGCDVMQGYFGSRPLHGAALAAWYNSL